MAQSRCDREIGEMVADVRKVLELGAGLKPGERVVAAVSGGIDSMVLLDILDKLRGCLEVELQVAHLDHRLRPESGSDRDFVEAAARKRGLACTSDSLDVIQFARQQRLSLEAAARHLRYQFLDRVALESGGAKIALGHQAGDQAETVLLRLLRGSGPGGLGAMDQVRDDRYIRPLLSFERAAIEAYARACDISFREDCTNRDLRFARNRVRHQLLPYLQRHHNPNIVATLGRTAQIVREENRFLSERALAALNAVVCERSARKIVLDRERFLNYHIAIQRRVIRTLTQGLSKREGPFDFARVETVLGMVRQRNGRLRQISSKLWSQHSGERFILSRGAPSPVEIPIHVPGETGIRSHGFSLKTRLLPVSRFPQLKPRLGQSRAVFDSDLAGPQLLLRSPRRGDRFQPLGMKGHKKLSDYLIDVKWPRILRDEVMLLTRGEEILWVVGMRASHCCRVGATTREILLVELMRNTR